MCRPLPRQQARLLIPHRRPSDATTDPPRRPRPQARAGRGRVRAAARKERTYGRNAGPLPHRRPVHHGQSGNAEPRHMGHQSALRPAVTDASRTAPPTSRPLSRAAAAPIRRADQEPSPPYSPITASLTSAIPVSGQVGSVDQARTTAMAACPGHALRRRTPPSRPPSPGDTAPGRPSSGPVAPCPPR